MRVCVTTTSCNLTKERKGNTATQPHITAKMDRTLEPSNKSINDRGRLASLSRGFYPSIVNNLRLRVEGLKLAGPRLSAIGSTRSAWGWSSRLIPVRHSHLISLGKLKDVSLGVLSVAHQLGEAIVAFQVTHLNTRT
jgi:hypothetical protein